MLIKLHVLLCIAYWFKLITRKMQSVLKSKKKISSLQHGKAGLIRNGDSSNNLDYLSSIKMNLMLEMEIKLYSRTLAPIPPNKPYFSLAETMLGSPRNTGPAKHQEQ